MTRAQSYRDLEIYQLAHKLAVEVHKMSLKLPRFEMYEEGRQIRKSSKSVPNNIVEGFGRRRYQGDFVRFLTYAHASCDETIEHLSLLFETGSLDEPTYRRFDKDYDTLGRKLNKFIQSVDRSHLTW